MACIHMKTFPLIALLLTAWSCSAHLAIYNFTATQTITGSGVETKVRIVGVLVVDLARERATRLGKFTVAATKQFVVDEEPEFEIWRAEGLRGPAAMMTSGYAATRTLTFHQGYTYALGKEAVVNIGPGTNLV